MKSLFFLSHSIDKINGSRPYVPDYIVELTKRVMITVCEMRPIIIIQTVTDAHWYCSVKTYELNNYNRHY